LPEESRQSICEIPPDEPIPAIHYDQTILDPFCGTGVILQEAALMGYHAYGSDLEPRMVDFSKQNLEWLGKEARLEQGDATAHQWQPPIDFVASEVYLGRPFTEKPNPEVLAQTVSDTNLIVKKFLQNVLGQIKPGARLCLAVPAWQTRNNEFKRLPLIDQISDLGYNLVKFEHSGSPLIYYRPDQIVGRELLVITRK
jgi:tRNA G10  N-methylase Trm11